MRPHQNATGRHLQRAEAFEGVGGKEEDPTADGRGEVLAAVTEADLVVGPHGACGRFWPSLRFYYHILRATWKKKRSDMFWFLLEYGLNLFISSNTTWVDSIIENS